VLLGGMAVGDVKRYCCSKWNRGIEAKGLDGSDRHLRKAIAYKAVQVLRRQDKRDELTRIGKRSGAVIWLSGSKGRDTW
jgi:hypothetical protein